MTKKDLSEEVIKIVLGLWVLFWMICYNFDIDFINPFPGIWLYCYLILFILILEFCFIILLLHDNKPKKESMISYVGDRLAIKSLFSLVNLMFSAFGLVVGRIIYILINMMKEIVQAIHSMLNVEIAIIFAGVIGFFAFNALLVYVIEMKKVKK